MCVVRQGRGRDGYCSCRSMCQLYYVGPLRPVGNCNIAGPSRMTGSHDHIVEAGYGVDTVLARACKHSGIGMENGAEWSKN